MTLSLALLILNVLNASGTAVLNGDKIREALSNVIGQHKSANGADPDKSLSPAHVAAVTAALQLATTPLPDDNYVSGG